MKKRIDWKVLGSLLLTNTLLEVLIGAIFWGNWVAILLISLHAAIDVGVVSALAGYRVLRIESKEEQGG